MKNKLKEFMDTVFADAEARAPRNRRLQELKEEMLRNLYDRYDDLVADGKSPAAAYSIAVAGVGDVTDLLDSVIGASYGKATFTASDGYAGSYGPAAVNAWYINEKDPSASLPMILAWTEDGSPCNLRLVMGQQIAGEYNRTYWVRDVITITLQ